MKNLTWRIVGSVLAVGALFMANCSGPLESARTPAPGQVDSVYVFDTIYSGDTVIYTDTVQITDTVIVVVTDTLLLPTTYCAQLSPNHREIIWLVQNLKGSFRLAFVATTSDDKPIQKLRVEVDDHEYLWEPVNDNQLVVEHSLDEASFVRISSESPHALGHTIDICLDLQDR